MEGYKNKIETSKRYLYFDCIKGILIVLVIIGHFLPGSLSENFARYMIYSFHMPVFFALSGYLFNTTKAVEMPLLKNISRYLIRFFPPWILANTVYYILNYYSGNEVLSFGRYIKQYFHQYYHLWYVLGFLFCVFIVLLYIKNITRRTPENLRVWGGDSINYVPLLIVSTMIFIISAIGFIVRLDGLGGRLLSIVDHNIRPQYLFFFCLGLIAKSGRLDNIIERTKHGPVTIFLLLATAIGFFVQNKIWGNLLEYVFAMCLFLDILWYKEKATKSRSIVEKGFIFCGQNSFAIYLWHVIGKCIALMMTQNQYNIAYYVICTMWVVLLCIVIKLFKNNLIYRKLIGAC